MEWLAERFRSAPETHAFIHDGTIVTYGEAADKIARSRAALIAQGVQPGETVVVLGDYSPDVVCLILALAELRAVVVPITRLAVIEIDAALAICGCDWRVDFAEDGIDFSLYRHKIASDNAMLADFRRAGHAGLILFSSGSTGTPKAILHDFDRVAEKFRNPRAATIAIPFLMLDHFGGINTILAILSSLGTIVTIRNRQPAAICEAIARHKVQLLPATPSFLTMLMASGLHKTYDLSSLTRITYGTEVMPQSTLDRLRAAFPGVEMQQTYGLSEVGVLRSQSRPDGSLWMRIGGAGFETKVVDGILWIRSDFRMVGYLNAPSEFDADGWFNTKDQVEVDGEYFRILGRVTDIINIGGQKVYPAEVEDVILELPNIADVAVYGEKHPLLGQIVVAKLILTDAEPADEVKKRIRKACLEKLSSFKAPTKVVVSVDPLYTIRQKKSRKADTPLA